MDLIKSLQELFLSKVGRELNNSKIVDKLYSCNNEMYIFNLNNIYSYITNNKFDDTDEVFQLLESMSILWCTQLDNVINDYFILVKNKGK